MTSPSKNGISIRDTIIALVTVLSGGNLYANVDTITDIATMKGQIVAMGNERTLLVAERTRAFELVYIALKDHEDRLRGLEKETRYPTGSGIGSDSGLRRRSNE